jgi:inner membrane protein involved in colicin E2 resistance
MKTSTKYIVATVLSLFFISMYVIIYFLFKDDETTLLAGFSMVSMAVTAIALLAATFFMRSSAFERYAERFDEQEEKK